MTLTSEEREKLHALGDRLKQIAEAQGGPMFMGKPERWWDAGRFRCINGHVSTHLLKSEALGGNVCLVCFTPVWLTFPEDQDGLLEVFHEGE